ncbi:MAG: UPF0280 family protein [Pseudomonadota bacterium]|nr:UPF0280 family protein [Pseudomonadota bacterium]
MNASGVVVDGRRQPRQAAATSGPARARLSDGRWHFQHGPIDCILAADGEAGAVTECIERAWRRFACILGELVGELPLLRVDLASDDGAAVAPQGPVARRMVAACRRHVGAGRFITAMAAVAGSVAEELIGCFDDARVRRAFVNNGGDIALHLRPGASYDVGLVAEPMRGLAGIRGIAVMRGLTGLSELTGLSDLTDLTGPRSSPSLDGRFTIDAASSVRGIATSGWRGRSFSLGIADAATVLAASASAADAAATVIGNAVDVVDARIVRRPAASMRDDSDLGERLVTCAVPPLDAATIERALAAGAAAARSEIAAGRIIASVLSLQGRYVVVEEPVRGVGEGDVRGLTFQRGAAPQPHATAQRSSAPC